MGHVRLTRAALAIIFFYGFLAVITYGVFVNWGLGWACMVGGAMFAACTLLLHDVDGKG